MPFEIFKEIKVRCNECQEIIFSKSDTEWVECPCGKTKVMGKSFKRIAGSNYTDLTVYDFSKTPEHKGWDDKREDYYHDKKDNK